MRRLFVFLGAVSLLAGCGDDDTTPPASPSITLTSSETAGTVARGASGTATLTLGRVNGYGGNVNFTAEGAPTGVTVTFTPATLSGAATTSTATIAVGSTAAPGTATLTFRATGSGVTDKTVTYALTVPTSAITVSAGTGTATAAQGANTTVPITITRTGGATGPVTLTAEGLPAGVTAAFAPTPIPDGSTTSTLTLTVGATATTGTFPIVVRAAGTGVQDQTATVQLTVTAAAAAGYTLTAGPAALSIGAGQPGTSTITIARTGGFTGNVTLGLEGAPAGVTGTFTPNPATSAANTSVLALTTTAAVVPGTYNLTVRGTATGQTDRTATIALTVTGPPGITVTLAPTTLSIAAGANSTSNVTIARVGGFTGDVALSTPNAPAGISATFAPATLTGTNTAAVATVAVGAGVTAGTYNLVVAATGAGGVVGNATLAVTVPAPSGFSLAATNASAAQGGTGNSTVTITRTGTFTGAVALTATGVPANVTAAFNPASATGGTSTLTFTAAANATPGTYTVTVNGTGTGAPNASTTLTLTVTASGGGGGNVNWRFCDASRIPLWFAFRNGSTGAWTPVTPSANNTFSFNLTGAVGSVAMVIPRTGGGTDGYVYLNTATELQGIAAGECTNNQGTPTKSLTGTVAGLAALQIGGVSVGGATATINGPATTYSLTNVPDRVTDLLAARNTIGAGGFTPDRGLIRRSVNYSAGSAIPLIDFAGSESFALTTATATIANAGADQVSYIQTFQTGNGASAPLGLGTPTGATATIYGVPSSMTQAGDLHAFIVGASNSALTSVRSFAQYNRELANRTYTLGGELTLPTLTTTATTPYARIRAAGTWQAEYPDAGASSMTQTSGVSRAWTINGSRGYFGTGAATYEFEVPDFTGSTGFQNTWGFVTGSPVSVNTSFYGYLTGTGGAITEGSSFRYAARTQTITP